MLEFQPDAGGEAPPQLILNSGARRKTVEKTVQVQKILRMEFHRSHNCARRGLQRIEFQLRSLGVNPRK